MTCQINCYTEFRVLWRLVIGEFRGCFVLMWLRAGDFVTHKIQRMVYYTRDKESSGWEHKQKEMTMYIQPVKAVQIPPHPPPLVASHHPQHNSNSILESSINQNTHKSSLTLNHVT